MWADQTFILTSSGGAAGERGSPEESQERWICGKGQREFPVLNVLSSGQTTFLSFPYLKKQTSVCFLFFSKMKPSKLITAQLSSDLYCMISFSSLWLFTDISLLYSASLSFCIIYNLWFLIVCIVHFLFAQEAASLISQRAVNPREMFKQRERGITPSDSDVPSAAPASPQPGITPALTVTPLCIISLLPLLQSSVSLCQVVVGVVNTLFQSFDFPSDCVLVS